MFIIAFMVGVKFDAPVVGDTLVGMPASQATPENGQIAGVTTVGLQPGDVVLAIDGQPADTFADLQIASAMSKPGVPIVLTVRREGIIQPLRFKLLPEKDPASKLLGIGIVPGKSTTIWKKDDGDFISESLDESGLSKAGVTLGMRIIRAGGRDVQSYKQFQQVVDASNGSPITTEWVKLGSDGQPAGSPVRAELAVKPGFQIQRYAETKAENLPNFEYGLFGMVPLPRINKVMEGDNSEILRAGDVILTAGNVEGPRSADVHEQVGAKAGSTIDLVLLRDGREVSVTAHVNRKGRMNVMLSPAWDVPILARSLDEVKVIAPGKSEMTIERTPIARLNPLPKTRIDSVGGVAVENWADIRRELRRQTEQAKLAGSGAAIELSTTLPTSGHDREVLELALTADQVNELHELPWITDLPEAIFEPIQVLRTANGNPLKAVSMGFVDTKRLVMLTYLTIDRLFRGSVGVDQLRGPLGIIHIGSKVADKGFMYMIFFLGMISVNLAVINFLPMPIVDGGLFLFLVYEKFKGRPPSLAFQNAATVIGLGLIVTMFLVVTWNDVVRLLS